MDPFRAVGRSRSTTFWHGGAPGLSVGDVVQPKSVLLRRGLTHSYLRSDSDYSSDVVYVTDYLDVARSFAALFPDIAGDVYEVTPSPSSSLRVDPDLPTASVNCKSATIVAVVERGVTMTMEEFVVATARFMKWEDGMPMYTEAGHMNPAPEWPCAQATQLAQLGTWLPWQTVLYDTRTGKCLLNHALVREFRLNLAGGKTIPK